MGTRSKPNPLPDWTLTLGRLIDRGEPIRAMCECRCPSIDVDLVALAARVGRDYSLVGRRSRCRNPAGCSGWVRFYYLVAVYRPLWTPADVARWSHQQLADLRAGVTRP